MKAAFIVPTLIAVYFGIIALSMTKPRKTSPGDAFTWRQLWSGELKHPHSKFSD